MIPTTPSRKLLIVLIAVAVVGSSVAFATTSTPTNADANQVTQVGETQDSTFVRVLHASPDAPAVDVLVENETVASNVSFGTVTEYLELQAGTYNVSIVAADNASTVVFEDEVAFEPRTVTTIAASGEISEGANASFEPIRYEDDAFTPTNDTSAISVVHLSPDAPAVDVTAENGSVVLADNVTFQNGSDYVAVPAGNYTVEVRSATATNDGPVVFTTNVSLDGGEAYSAYAVGYLNVDDAPAETPFEVVVTEDATFTLQLPSEDEPANATTNETTTEEETETTVGETETETTVGETETETTVGETETETTVVGNETETTVPGNETTVE